MGSGITVAHVPGTGRSGLLFSEQVIFQPPAPSYQDNGEVVKLTTRDGKKISALYESLHSAKKVRHKPDLSLLSHTRKA
jgi:hypothetical protein